MPRGVESDEGATRSAGLCPAGGPQPALNAAWGRRLSVDSLSVCFSEQGKALRSALHSATERASQGVNSLALRLKPAGVPSVRAAHVGVETVRAGSLLAEAARDVVLGFLAVRREEDVV